MSRIRVDWFRVVAELQGAGYNTENIAAAIGVARSTLMGWRNPPYAEPRHADGERLVQLWCRVVEQPRDALPLNVEDLMSAAKASGRRR
jgi:hypothetical protein